MQRGLPGAGGVLLDTPLRRTAKKLRYPKVRMGESCACRCKPGLYGIVKGSLLAAEVPNITVPLCPTGLKLECGQAGAFSNAEATVSLGSKLCLPHVPGSHPQAHPLIQGTLLY